MTATELGSMARSARVTRSELPSQTYKTGSLPIKLTLIAVFASRPIAPDRQYHTAHREVSHQPRPGSGPAASTVLPAARSGLAIQGPAKRQPDLIRHQPGWSL